MFSFKTIDLTDPCYLLLFGMKASFASVISIPNTWLFKTVSANVALCFDLISDGMVRQRQWTFLYVIYLEDSSS